MDNDDFTTIFFRRENRNQLLKESDKYLLPDYPITPEKLELVKEYRNKLRDYMNLPEVKNYNSSINPNLPNLPNLPKLEDFY